MKLLTRYLFKDISHYFLLFVTMFVVVLLVSQIYDAQKDLLENSPKLIDVIQYLLFSIPFKLSQTLPLIGLLCTIFSYGLLAKNREILAMVAAGVSFRTIAVPAVLFGLLLTAFMFWFSEEVVPASQSRANYIEKVVIKGKSGGVFTTRKNLLVKGRGNRFYYMKNYFSDKLEMIQPTMLEVSPDGSGIQTRIEADRGVRISGQDKRQLWEFTNAERWQFNPDGSVKAYEKFSGPLQIAMEEDLNKFLTKTKKPEEMNFGELWAYRNLLAQKGDRNLQAYDVNLQQKLAFPLACLLMTLLGFAVVVDVHARRFARGVFTGLLVAVGFYMLNAFLRRMGIAGTVPPLLSGWLPVVAFAGMVYLLLTRLSRIRG